MYFCKKLFDSVWQDPKYTSENFPKVTAFLSTSAFHLIRELIWGLHSDPSSQKQLLGCSIKNVFLKNFASFREKHQCWSLFWMKLQAWRSANLFKGDTNTRVFLWNSQNFKEQLFWRTSSNNCLCLGLQPSVNAKNLLKREAEGLTENICRDPNPEE